MKLIKETGNSAVYDDGDKIIKKFKERQGDRLNEKWFEDYEKLSRNLTCVPKILSYIPKQEMVMEKFNGIPMREWVYEQYDLAVENFDSFIWGKCILQCMKIISDINSEFINYSAKVGQFVKHNDLSVHNVLMTSKNNYCLIDLDSIIFDWAGSRVDPYAHIWLNDMYVHYKVSQFKVDSENEKSLNWKLYIKDIIENSMNT